MQVLSIIGGKLTDYAIEPVVRQVGYVINFKSNVENLETQLEHLRDAKTRVEHSVEEALRKGHRIEADVEKWKKSVDEIIKEADEFKDENKLKKTCLFGFCPSSISSRYRQSRKATKIAQKVVEIRKRGEFLNGVSYTTSPKDIWTTDRYQVFESRNSFLNKIMEELRDPDIYVIGIYGMPGVGKSTLVKEVANQAVKNLSLDVVIVEVKQNADEKVIQKEIAAKFGPELDENMSVATRARLLSDQIKKKNKVLVILDDVCEMLNLEKLGLPFGICKILLTSRIRDVLISPETGTQKDFRLEVLDDQETWSWFNSIVGDALKNVDIREVAIEISKRCHGLPILVVTVATTLKSKSLRSWKEALRLQKNFEGKGLQDKAYSGIEWCYTKLDGEDVKSLFLICGMLGRRHYLLDDLFKYTKGLGLSLFKGIKTMEEARCRFHSLVEKLNDFCLLTLDTNEEQFTMHDLTRDVARYITSRNQHFLSLADGDDLKEWPKKDILEQYSLISFNQINIPRLPEQLDCPKLQLFSLYATEKSLTIPINFFKEMKELKVLDLTNICIPSLPPSLHFLTSLQTLCLCQCRLSNISMVGELRSLEILSFQNSKFKLLPKEIGKLTRLLVLDLSNCSELEVIHPDVISSLTRLEELNMNCNFNQWEKEGININERSNARVSELNHLPNLTTLDINIKDASQFPSLSEKLVNFKISIGDVWNRSAKYTTSRTLKLKLSPTNKLDQCLKTLMKKSEDLYLDILEGFDDIVDQLDMDSFPRLKYLHVQNNPVNCWSSLRIEFPNLEALFLCNLINLESLCSGQLPLESYKHLTTIEVEKCPKLKNLFSFSTVLSHFSQLQEIKVVDCDNMKEIVVEEKYENLEDHVNDRIEFCQLQTLTLQSLPELTCFASNNEIDSFMGLFNYKVVFPKLEMLKLLSIPLSKFWDGQLLARSSWVENLTSLIVDGCDGLPFLFSSSMAINFVQLKKLRIRRCQNMVDIISTEAYNGIEEKMDNMFPKLEYLELYTLGNLETFCSSATYLKFSCLNFLYIKECTKLGSFIVDRNIRDAALHYLFDAKVGFPCLKKLVIKGLHKLMTIWHTHLDPNSFSKLTEIWVEDCPSLIHILGPAILQRLDSTVDLLNVWKCDSLQVVFNVKEASDTLLAPHHLEKFNFRLCEVDIRNCRSLKNVFPASLVRNRNLGKLQKLWIFDCEMLEQIVGEEVGVEEVMPTFVFPSTKEVFLFNLPQLSSFYPGRHTSKWPSLIELEVTGCYKLEVLAAESSCFQQQHDTYKQVFFLYEKDSFSNLKNLTLSITETLCGSLPVDFFKIKNILVYCEHITSVVPLSVFFKKCHNLETLRMFNNGDIEEIFICEGSLDGEQHLVGTLSQLKNLKIVGMSNLMHVWKDSSHLAGPLFPNLETLRLHHCPRLENIVSSAISYRNIVELEVLDCNGLKHLVTYSVAKSFINLERMIVKKCERMIEIVESDEDRDIDVENEITFSRLQHMELSDLPNLKGFCCRDYNVRFPVLETLLVSSCLEMKISSDGVLLDDSKRERIPIVENYNDDSHITTERRLRLFEVRFIVRSHTLKDTDDFA